MMRPHKISELPVVDDDGRPVGLLDITDLIGAEPAAAPAPPDRRRSRVREEPDGRRMADVFAERFAAHPTAAAGRGRRADRRPDRVHGRRAEIKAFHVRDGSGLKFWQRRGKRVAILSGRSSPAVARRAAELGIDPVVQGADDKLPALRRILSETGLRPDQVCAVGDDLPDLPVLTQCGLAVAVADASPRSEAVAHFVTTAPGGRGAVREVVEWLMRAQGTWDPVVAGLLGDRRRRRMHHPSRPHPRTGTARRGPPSPLGTFPCGPPGASSWPLSVSLPSPPATSGTPASLGTLDGLPPLPDRYAPRGPAPAAVLADVHLEQWIAISSWPSGRTARNSRYPIKTELKGRHVLLAARDFKILKAGDPDAGPRAGWVRFLALSLASFGEKRGPRASPEINSLYADGRT